VEASQQYADFSGVQDRLVAVTARTSSIDEAAYTEAARVLGAKSQQTTLDELAALYQSSLSIRDHYFIKSSDSVLSSLDRGVSMLGRYWGFADTQAATAVAALNQAVQGYEANAKAIEDQAGVKGNIGTFQMGTDTVDPLEAGKQEQKDDVRRALGSYVPWIIGGLVVLFLLRKYT
jgi:hypothetical protein